VPTFEEISDLSPLTLNSLEREIVRQLLSITGKAGTATYIDSETRMSALTASQNQIVRGLILDYNDILLDTTKALGGSKGVNYDPERDKEAIARELRRLLYPSSVNEAPDEDTEGFSPLGSIHFIPTVYKSGNQGNFS